MTRFSNILLVAMFAAGASAGLPTNGVPTNSLPTNGLPSNGTPSNGTPSNGSPSNGTGLRNSTRLPCLDAAATLEIQSLTAQIQALDAEIKQRLALRADLLAKRQALQGAPTNSGNANHAAEAAALERDAQLADIDAKIAALDAAIAADRAAQTVLYARIARLRAAPRC